MKHNIKGKCKYCGKEYTLGYMKRHLLSCRERQQKQDEEKGTGKGAVKCGYFELQIYDRYNHDYWLFIEVRETAKLRDVDCFLRDIWLECCGHLSAFYINGVSYEAFPQEDFFDGEHSESMDCQLKSVLKKGIKFTYEYDFGSTTELVINVINYRVGGRRKEGLTILSRNNPLELICSECGKKPAVAICPQCIYENGGLLCEDCRETHACGEEVLLEVCNSPRMGVCCYEGSDKYPDQFVPDCF